MSDRVPLENINSDDLERMLTAEDGLAEMEALLDEVVNATEQHIESGIPSSLAEEAPAPTPPSAEDNMSFSLSALVQVTPDPDPEAESEPAYVPPAATKAPVKTTISTQTEDQAVKPSVQTLKQVQPIAERKGDLDRGVVPKSEKKVKDKKLKIKKSEHADAKEKEEQDPKLRTIDQSRLEEGLKERQKRISDLFDDKGNVT